MPMLTAMRLLAKKEPTQVEQKALADFQKLSKSQQAASIQRMAKLAAEQAEHRIASLRLISLFVIKGTGRRRKTAKEPIQAEQKAQVDFRRLTTEQQVRHLDRLVTKHREQGKGTDDIVRLLGSFIAANSTTDARAERTKHDRPTKRKGAGNANKALPVEEANPATANGEGT